MRRDTIEIFKNKMSFEFDRVLEIYVKNYYREKDTVGEIKK